MKKYVYEVVSFVMVFLLLTNMQNVYAVDSEGGSSSINHSINSSDDTDFWGAATKWFSNVNTNDYNENTSYIIDEFTTMIRLIGSAVITCVTIFLGVKYIFGSVESKADVKEGLITLFVVCVFFFGWSSISNLLFPENHFIFVSEADTSYTAMVGRIFETVTYILQFVVLIGVIYVGVKYIFAGVNGKADLKSKAPMFFIGIILAFCSTTVLSYISNLVIDTLE